MVGGSEPTPVVGHLSGGEPIVKPTQQGRFLFLAGRGGFWGRANKGLACSKVEGHKIILKRKGGESFLK